MIELFESNLKDTQMQSSKGNQLKWENEGIWYKADYMGYEGLAEYIISHLLKYSSLSEEEYVLYNPEEIQYKGKIHMGAKSKNFVESDWQLITLERLYQSFAGDSLNKAIYHIHNHKERFQFLVTQVERITGLKKFGAYLNKLFTMDGLFLNEDRHTHNIAVLMSSKGEFAYCPIFDNGACLLSDTTMDYPLEGDIYEQIASVRPKTFCQDFLEQIEISEELAGSHIRFSFTGKEIDSLLSEATAYTREEKKRVQTILYQQMRKYKYLFD